MGGVAVGDAKGREKKRGTFAKRKKEKGRHFAGPENMPPHST